MIHLSGTSVVAVITNNAQRIPNDDGKLLEMKSKCGSYLGIGEALVHHTVLYKKNVGDYLRKIRKANGRVLEIDRAMCNIWTHMLVYPGCGPDACVGSRIEEGEFHIV